jgi:hypothetical protein
VAEQAEQQQAEPWQRDDHEDPRERRGRHAVPSGDDQREREQAALEHDERCRGDESRSDHIHAFIASP